MKITRTDDPENPTSCDECDKISSVLYTVQGSGKSMVCEGILLCYRCKQKLQAGTMIWTEEQ